MYNVVLLDKVIFTTNWYIFYKLFSIGLWMWFALLGTFVEFAKHPNFELLVDGKVMVVSSCYGWVWFLSRFVIIYYWIVGRGIKWKE